MASLNCCRGAVSHCARVGIEGVVLAMLALAPWMFGAVHPLAEFVLAIGLAVILLLWAVRLTADGGPIWSPCGVGICLGLICLLGVAQTLPLPDGVLKFLSPATSEIYQEMFPATLEKPRLDSISQPSKLSTLSVA